ncbi:uncharacterized protein NECHADRAFT_86959 [Fusarium vanettenii 77-13-4]|uniref:Uncharacterized protein n=1 Tax=Fusarium vanettenii (strain ATCC MYA-4622 / CBS 123669 / FGSC 9596 / NRRL 45880 / 77-13-4) TaxID=660122 RepID=C7ZI18_FUSV7|nr:uncharacterized protein NECHADRAFT_86959 [Fusarium vanettenii 77-13-4]EEU36388.1 hypothetical protein NECHADRAFT_86959 [Fusarium vanettenii 77-13-4]
MGYQAKDPYPAPGLTSDKGSQPVTVGFLDLPGPVREGIYKHVLTIKHPVYLFQDFGRRVEAFAPDQPKWWIALLYTNRQISSEAKAVLYDNNNFHLMDNPQKHGALLQSFLGSIGSHNANVLSRLCIGFPVAEKAQGQPHTVTIRQDSLQSLSLIRGQCTRLKTLEMQMCKENSKLLAGAREEDAQLVRDALLRVDAQLKTISSLKNVVVRLSIKGVPSLVVDTMRGLAWVVLDG